MRSILRRAQGWRLLALAVVLFGGACRREGDGALRQPQKLYERAPARVRALEVDERNVYWLEFGPDGNQVMMAAKVGGGTPVVLGSWYTYDRSLNFFVVDQTHVYWAEQTRVNRVKKDDPGDVTRIDLGAGHGGGGLAGGEHDVFLVDLNCTAIGKISKADLAVAFTPITEASPLGGVTGIALDASDVFCGRGPNLFVQPRSGGPIAKLVGDQESIGPVASDGTNVYWGNNRSVLGTRTENVAMIPRSGATPAADLGLSGGIGQLGALRLDSKRRRLYWMSCPASSVPITTMDLDSKRFDNLIEEQNSEGCGFADDDTHLYWATRNGIMRLAK